MVDDRRRQGFVFALMIAGMILALLCVNTVRRRADECAAVLPPATYVVGVIALFIGLVALVLLARWFRRGPQAIVVVLFVTAAAGVVFEVFVLITAILEGRPDCG
ncbi:hypothetical protein EV644_118151 [Kribbella orskensis]|uniref:Integral membrane protein n=1 Tax=Kribbella orskensis TaxID=2512216 RepID=A0ABY2BCQ0_9ACTN|nr:hypothetical protein EV642_119150 [Kribbella sp. VKM Ac-2500]TCO15607.1 hypothetical protein EV644_118151 [Kribbella orskensis]